MTRRGRPNTGQRRPASTLATAALAAAVAVTAAPAARAAPAVKLYGTIDLYLDATHHAGGALLRLDSNGQLPSVVGIRVDEPLAADLRLIAQAETAFNPDGTPTSSPPLDRLHFAELDTPWGEVATGKQFTPHFFQLGLRFDPFQTAYWGSAYAVFEGANRYTRVPNTFSYDSPELLGGRVSASALYSSSDPRAGRLAQRPQWYLSATIKPGAGLAIGLSGIRDHRYDDAHPDASLLLFGAAWKIGTVELSGAAQSLRVDDSSLAWREFVVGARVAIDEANEVALTHARSSATRTPGATAAVDGIALSHAVSPRLAVYASVARLVDGQASALDFGTEGAPGRTSVDQMIGVRLRF